MQDREILNLEKRIRPPQFDELPPEVRELSPGQGGESGRDAEMGGYRTTESAVAASGIHAPARVLDADANQLTLSLFEQIRTPALLLTGGADMMAPPALMKILASHIPNAEFLVVPNAGHSVYWEEPELFDGTVLNFIRKH